jgi:hypothetical protein
MSRWAKNAVAKGSFEDNRDATLAQARERNNSRLFNELVRIYHRENRYLKPDLPKLADPYSRARATARRSAKTASVPRASADARRFGLYTSVALEGARLTSALSAVERRTPASSASAPASATAHGLQRPATQRQPSQRPAAPRVGHQQRTSADAEADEEYPSVAAATVAADEEAEATAAEEEACSPATTARLQALGVAVGASARRLNGPR